MKKIVSTVSLLFFLCSCDIFIPDERSVRVRIDRSNTTIWAFNISADGAEKFSSTECGSNNQAVDDCVNFTIPHLGGYAFDYEFQASKGDDIEVIISGNNNCYATTSIWVYSDDQLIGSEIDNCDDCSCGSIYVDVELD